MAHNRQHSGDTQREQQMKNIIQECNQPRDIIASGDQVVRNNGGEAKSESRNKEKFFVQVHSGGRLSRLNSSAGIPE